MISSSVRNDVSVFSVPYPNNSRGRTPTHTLARILSLTKLYYTYLVPSTDLARKEVLCADPSHITSISSNLAWGTLQSEGAKTQMPGV